MKMKLLALYLSFTLAGFSTGMSVFCLAYSDVISALMVSMAALVLGISSHASYVCAIKLKLMKNLSSLHFVPYINMAAIALLLYATGLMSDLSMVLLAVGLAVSSLSWWFAAKFSGL